MKTIAAVVMVINMFGTTSDGYEAVDGVERARTDNAIVKIVEAPTIEAAAHQCTVAAKATAHDLGLAGIDAVVGCAEYSGPLNTDLTLIESRMYVAYKSVTTEE